MEGILSPELQVSRMKKTPYFLLLFLVLSNFVFAKTINFEQYAVRYWHDTLAQYLHVENEQLKITQGYTTIENTSYSLWNIFDAMASYDPSDMYYNPIQNNSFASSYGMILYNYPISPSPNSTCNLNPSILKYVDANYTYAWDKTIDTLFNELAQSKPINLISEANISLDDTGSLYTIKIEAKYQSFLLFQSLPYSQYDGNITNYLPWFTPCILNNAYHDTSNPYWEPTFGPNGFVQNITTALVVAQNGSTCISIFNNNPDSNNSMNYSNCIQSKLPHLLGVIIYPIMDFIRLY